MFSLHTTPEEFKYATITGYLYFGFLLRNLENETKRSFQIPPPFEGVSVKCGPDGGGWRMAVRKMRMENADGKCG